MLKRRIFGCCRARNMMRKLSI